MIAQNKILVLILFGIFVSLSLYIYTYQTSLVQHHAHTRPPYHKDPPLTSLIDLCKPVPDMKSRILFYHLPKVAGNFIRKGVVRAGLHRTDKACFVSHCGYNVFRNYSINYAERIQKDLVLMVAVRHPKDRIRSEWHHAMHNIQKNITRDYHLLFPWDHRSIYFDSEFVQDMTDGKYNITSFIQLGDINPANNRLTRMLSGVAGPWPIDNPGLASSDFSPFYRDVAHDPEKKQEMLQQAKENLTKFHIVALTSRINATCTMFETIFNLSFPLVGKESPSVVEPDAQSPSVVEPDTHLDEVILQHNQLDVELYHFAEKLFDKRLESCSYKL